MCEWKQTAVELEGILSPVCFGVLLVFIIIVISRTVGD